MKGLGEGYHQTVSVYPRAEHTYRARISRKDVGGTTFQAAYTPIDTDPGPPARGGPPGRLSEFPGLQSDSGYTIIPIDSKISGQQAWAAQPAPSKQPAYSGPLEDALSIARTNAVKDSKAPTKPKHAGLDAVQMSLQDMLAAAARIHNELLASSTTNRAPVATDAAGPAAAATTSAAGHAPAASRSIGASDPASAFAGTAPIPNTAPASDGSGVPQPHPLAPAQYSPPAPQPRGPLEALRDELFGSLTMPSPRALGRPPTPQPTGFPAAPPASPAAAPVSTPPPRMARGPPDGLDTANASPTPSTLRAMETAALALQEETSTLTAQAGYSYADLSSIYSIPDSALNATARTPMSFTTAAVSELDTPSSVRSRDDEYKYDKSFVSPKSSERDPSTARASGGRSGRSSQLIYERIASGYDDYVSPASWMSLREQHRSSHVKVTSTSCPGLGGPESVSSTPTGPSGWASGGGGGGGGLIDLLASASAVAVAEVLSMPPPASQASLAPSKSSMPYMPSETDSSVRTGSAWSEYVPHGNRGQLQQHHTQQQQQWQQQQRQPDHASRQQQQQKQSQQQQQPAGGPLDVRSGRAGSTASSGPHNGFSSFAFSAGPDSGRGRDRVTGSDHLCRTLSFGVPSGTLSRSGSRGGSCKGDGGSLSGDSGSSSAGTAAAPAGGELTEPESSVAVSQSTTATAATADRNACSIPGAPYGGGGGRRYANATFTNPLYSQGSTESGAAGGGCGGSTSSSKSGYNRPPENRAVSSGGAAATPPPTACGGASIATTEAEEEGEEGHERVVGGQEHGAEGGQGRAETYNEYTFSAAMARTTVPHGPHTALGPNHRQRPGHVARLFSSPEIVDEMAADALEAAAAAGADPEGTVPASSAISLADKGGIHPIVLARPPSMATALAPVSPLPGVSGVGTFAVRPLAAAAAPGAGVSAVALDAVPEQDRGELVRSWADMRADFGARPQGSGSHGGTPSVAALTPEPSRDDGGPVSALPPFGGGGGGEAAGQEALLVSSATRASAPGDPAGGATPATASAATATTAEASACCHKAISQEGGASAGEETHQEEHPHQQQQEGQQQQEQQQEQQQQPAAGDNDGSAGTGIPTVATLDTGWHYELADPLDQLLSVLAGRGARSDAHAQRLLSDTLRSAVFDAVSQPRPNSAPVLFSLDGIARSMPLPLAPAPDSATAGSAAAAAVTAATRFQGEGEQGPGAGLTGGGESAGSDGELLQAVQRVAELKAARMSGYSGSGAAVAATAAALAAATSTPHTSQHQPQLQAQPAPQPTPQSAPSAQPPLPRQQPPQQHLAAAGSGGGVQPTSSVVGAAMLPSGQVSGLLQSISPSASMGSLDSEVAVERLKAKMRAYLMQNTEAAVAAVAAANAGLASGSSKELESSSGGSAISVLLSASKAHPANMQQQLQGSATQEAAAVLPGGSDGSAAAAAAGPAPADLPALHVAALDSLLQQATRHLQAASDPSASTSGTAQPSLSALEEILRQLRELTRRSSGSNGGVSAVVPAAPPPRSPPRPSAAVPAAAANSDGGPDATFGVTADGMRSRGPVSSTVTGSTAQAPSRVSRAVSSPSRLGVEPAAAPRAFSTAAAGGGDAAAAAIANGSSRAADGVATHAPVPSVVWGPPLFTQPQQPASYRHPPSGPAAGPHTSYPAPYQAPPPYLRDDPAAHGDKRAAVPAAEGQRRQGAVQDAALRRSYQGLQSGAHPYPVFSSFDAAQGTAGAGARGSAPQAGGPSYLELAAQAAKLREQLAAAARQSPPQQQPQHQPPQQQQRRHTFAGTQPAQQGISHHQQQQNETLQNRAVYHHPAQPDTRAATAAAGLAASADWQSSLQSKLLPYEAIRTRTSLIDASSTFAVAPAAASNGGGGPAEQMRPRNAAAAAARQSQPRSRPQSPAGFRPGARTNGGRAGGPAGASAPATPRNGDMPARSALAAAAPPQQHRPSTKMGDPAFLPNKPFLFSFGLERETRQWLDDMGLTVTPAEESLPLLDNPLRNGLLLAALAACLAGSPLPAGVVTDPPRDVRSARTNILCALDHLGLLAAPWASINWSAGSLPSLRLRGSSGIIAIKALGSAGRGYALRLKERQLRAGLGLIAEVESILAGSADSIWGLLNFIRLAHAPSQYQQQLRGSVGGWMGAGIAAGPGQRRWGTLAGVGEELARRTFDVRGGAGPDGVLGLGPAPVPVPAMAAAAAAAETAATAGPTAAAGNGPPTSRSGRASPGRPGRGGGGGPAGEDGFSQPAESRSEPSPSPLRGGGKVTLAVGGRGRVAGGPVADPRGSIFMTTGPTAGMQPASHGHAAAALASAASSASTGGVAAENGLLYRPLWPTITSLPYSPSEVATLESSLLQWLMEAGAISRREAAQGFPALLPMFEDGTFICWLVSNLSGRPIVGAHRRPLTEAARRTNWFKAIEALRKLPGMSRRFLVYEEALMHCERPLLTGLLEDLHRLAGGMPPAPSKILPDAKPYLPYVVPEPVVRTLPPDRIAINRGSPVASPLCTPTPGRTSNNKAPSNLGPQGAARSRKSTPSPSPRAVTPSRHWSTGSGGSATAAPHQQHPLFQKAVPPPPCNNSGLPPGQFNKNANGSPGDVFTSPAAAAAAAAADSDNDGGAGGVNSAREGSNGSPGRERRPRNVATATAAAAVAAAAAGVRRAAAVNSASAGGAGRGLITDVMVTPTKVLPAAALAAAIQVSEQQQQMQQQGRRRTGPAITAVDLLHASFPVVWANGLTNVRQSLPGHPPGQQQQQQQHDRLRHHQYLVANLRGSRSMGGALESFSSSSPAVSPRLRLVPSAL
ncbi:hypothetical protein VOLCADRAFT_93166 [Volvox carteri f. nagariensis]|uniref:Calponin-homology (CH) domain-containing protein n=1 Tax=Volvox carteri f. nagariensis TaxID=3068 RepID=D8U1G7_VOLCA|nr:uncharacterized protein VOLCADRAFT_93166 [Volvox carteri f. nagariensis]EFJ46337.1 hypothetical protein VOLCADRAFT_93166 [Volvox carteri f. nagariensis]|eukprot:XP_002952490.1 hypothetical protein VOLCADRAFT_93166 [Volvox carteri f. nagariensis]